VIVPLEGEVPLVLKNFVAVGNCLQNKLVRPEMFDFEAVMPSDMTLNKVTSYRTDASAKRLMCYTGLHFKFLVTGDIGQSISLI
jgi:hypothetical protein